MRTHASTNSSTNMSGSAGSSKCSSPGAAWRSNTPATARTSALPARNGPHAGIQPRSRPTDSATSAPEMTAAASCDHPMIRRRSTRSASTPAGSDSTSSGMTLTSPTRPSAVAEWVHV